MTLATDRTSPHRLLAIDLGAIPDWEQRGWTRLGDRIAAIRVDTILVYVGTRNWPGMPEPDYAVDSLGETIVRLHGGVALDDWPRVRESTGVAAALIHLAEAHLIHLSEVYCVVASTRVIPETLERVVVVGGEAAPPDHTWVQRADEDTLISALEEIRLFPSGSAATYDIADMAFGAALDTLKRNITDLGFSAASVADNPLLAYDANYAAVWARDGVITGLWTLCLDDPELVDAFRRTIRALARHQTASGQIPTNVRLKGEQPDYSGTGGIAGIDSVIWFVIGAVRLAFHLGDRQFAADVVEPVERAMQWLAAHDANNDGLIEIPESSDWMDIFPRSYNVLYDEVLWWQACLDTAAIQEAMGKDGSSWRDRATQVRAAILDQFWPTGEQLMEFGGTQPGKFSPGEAYYMLSQITPFDYGWRCDVYANLLAALSGLLDERKLDRLFTFLWGVGVNSPFPVACLYPPIASGAEDWKDYFLVNFLNLPDHYHNGGIWPFIGGLWVRFLASIGRVELAHRELAGLAEACRQGVNGEWEFNEWLHGRTGRPMGKTHQAWSAASYVHAYSALHHDVQSEAFPDLDPAALRDATDPANE